MNGLEYRTETFRGTKCLRAMGRWRGEMERAGWEYSTWSGVSGIGKYQAVSMTMVRTARVPQAVEGQQSPLEAWLIDRVQTLTALRQADVERANHLAEELADTSERARLLELRVGVLENAVQWSQTHTAALPVVQPAGYHAWHAHRDADMTQPMERVP